MSIKGILRPRYVVAIILVLILMAVTYAYAAANVVPPSSVGDGSGAISGYTVSNVTYTLDNADPTLIDMVTFDIAGASAPITTKAQLVSAGGAWYTCSVTVSPTYECNVGGAVTALAADQLRVVAAQ